jgi:hypothetical protein
MSNDDAIATVLGDARSARASAQSIESPEVRRALERLADGLEDLARFVKANEARTA